MDNFTCRVCFSLEITKVNKKTGCRWPIFGQSINLGLFVETDFCQSTFRYTVTISATRFDENSPLWQNFKIFGQIFKGSFSIWKNFELILANYYTIVKILVVVNDPIWTIMCPSGHTADYASKQELWLNNSSKKNFLDQTCFKLSFHISLNPEFSSVDHHFNKLEGSPMRGT